MKNVGLSFVKDTREMSGPTEEASDSGAIKRDNRYAELLEILYPRVTRFLGDCNDTGCEFRAIQSGDQIE